MAEQAAESPWSNGVVEKHNGGIGNMMEKVLSNVKFTFDNVLAWCFRAKNYLLSSYGYNPNEIVFGYNPNFPPVLNNLLPAQNGVASNELISYHFFILHAARKIFIEIELDEKLRRVLSHKTISVTSLISQNSNQVCYNLRII